MRRNRTLALLTLVATTLLVSACTTGGSGPTSSVDASAPTSTHADSSSPASSGSESKATVVPVPAVLDRSSVAGLTPHQNSTVDPNDQRSIATVSVPGQDSLNSALNSIANAHVAAYVKRRSDGVANELNVGWDPILAAGDILGIRVSTRIYTGGAHSTTTTTSVYTDVKADKTSSASALIAKPAQLVRWVSEAVTAAELGHATPEEIAVKQDLRFASDGSMTIVLDQGTVGSEANGDVAVHIPSDLVSDVLTTAGKSVRAAAMAAAPFTGVPSPAPPTIAEPSTVAPVTGSPQATGTPVDCAKLKCVALTFDDGPGPYTEKLLTELKAKDTHVTFFLIGGSAATRPDIVKREVAAGHAIGNHTWDHPDLSSMSSGEIADEIDRSAAAIKSAAKISTNLVRPPYGSTNDTVAGVLKTRHAAQILWNVDTEDWKNRSVAITTQRALAGAKPGAIILMHDIHPSTVDAVPGIINQLRARGFTLVTIPELLGSDLTPGAKYFSR